MGKSEYAIPLELLAKPEIKLEILALHEKRSAKMVVVLTSQAIWQKLIIGQKFEGNYRLKINEPLIKFSKYCQTASISAVIARFI